LDIILFNIGYKCGLILQIHIFR